MANYNNNNNNNAKQPKHLMQKVTLGYALEFSGGVLNERINTFIIVFMITTCEPHHFLTLIISPTLYVCI